MEKRLQTKEIAPHDIHKNVTHIFDQSENKRAAVKRIVENVNEDQDLAIALLLLNDLFGLEVKC